MRVEQLVGEQGCGESKGKEEPRADRNLGETSVRSVTWLDERRKEQTKNRDIDQATGTSRLRRIRREERATETEYQREQGATT